MINGSRLLAIVPARGGSKRIPRKNIIELAGKPLISWTIEAALNSNYIDRVIVSTDDNEIAQISKKYGAEVPFIRPKELASDTATSVDVVLHVLDELCKESDIFDFIVLLQPTSPLRTTQHIDDAIEQLIMKHSLSIISVYEAAHNPIWCNRLGEDGSMSGFIKPEYANKRSQDLPKYYCLNGAIYICDTSVLYTNHDFFSETKCDAFIMDRKDSIDIDDVLDFELVKIIMKDIQLSHM